MSCVYILVAYVELNFLLSFQNLAKDNAKQANEYFLLLCR